MQALGSLPLEELLDIVPRDLLRHLRERKRAIHEAGAREAQMLQVHPHVVQVCTNRASQANPTWPCSPKHAVRLDVLHFYDRGTSASQVATDLNDRKIASPYRGSYPEFVVVWSDSKKSYYVLHNIGGTYHIMGYLDDDTKKRSPHLESLMIRYQPIHASFAAPPPPTY